MSDSTAPRVPTSEEYHVAIIDSGVANLAAVESALTDLGVAYTITGDPKAALQASHVVLPGVGRFSAGLETLRRDGLDAAVCEIHERGTPLLAVCLGMQMLGDGSDESPDTPGLGIVSGRFQRLPDSVRVPHLGWNREAQLLGHVHELVSGAGFQFDKVHWGLRNCFLHLGGRI